LPYKLLSFVFNNLQGEKMTNENEFLNIDSKPLVTPKLVDHSYLMRSNTTRAKLYRTLNNIEPPKLESLMIRLKDMFSVKRRS
jgi:hypothetical protein